VWLGYQNAGARRRAVALSGEKCVFCLYLTAPPVSICTMCIVHMQSIYYNFLVIFEEYFVVVVANDGEGF
jgi:hypothetical protein